MTKTRLKLTPKAQDLRRQKDVVESMLSDGERLLDRRVLLRHLKRFGLSGNLITAKPLAHQSDWINRSRAGPIQMPTEFVEYLLYAARFRPKSVAEIGVENGGFAVFSAAFFQALEEDCVYHCIDPEDRFRSHPRIKERLNLKFHIPATSDDLAGEKFDVVFVDGDHSYEWAARDFENLGKHARYLCAFHDIHGWEYHQDGGGVFRFWRELRQTMPHEASMLEIAHSAYRENAPRALWMGIGLIDFSGSPDTRS